MDSTLNRYDKTLETLNKFQKRFADFKRNISKKKVLLGFDGYVDSLYSLVKKRISTNNWIRMRSMTEMSNQLKNSAGSSLGMELVLKKVTSGGFTSNTCKGLNALGVPLNLISSWGFPRIEEPFDRLSKLPTVQVHSICSPGTTVALEFDDGKVMLTDMENTFKITWKLIKQRLGMDRIIDLVNDVNIFGVGYWASIPDLNDIWHHILNDVILSVDDVSNKIMFVDLADIKKRKSNDILDMLGLLSKLNENFPVLLSLNDQEAFEVAKILKIDYRSAELFLNLGVRLNEKLNLNSIVIHTPHFATITTTREHVWISQAYTSRPKFTTAAGDHFNSGVMAGIAGDLMSSEALLLGNIVTSNFIQTGVSPSLEDLQIILNKFEQYIRNNNPSIL